MWGKARCQEEIRCSLVKPPDVYLEPIPRQKIAFLMEEYPSQEWLAYLVGTKSNNDNFFVADISVPPHKEANAGTAEAEPLHIPKNCVGIIHSHHRMGAFHSGTDQAYVDRNFPVSITVARGNEGGLTFDAVSYQKTPCGRDVTLTCSVKYVQPKPTFDKEKFLEGAKENIDKSKRAYVFQGAEAYQRMFGLDEEYPYIPVRYRISVDNKGKVTVKGADGKEASNGWTNR